MKKLMIVATLAMAVATSFGATYNWNHKSGQYIYDGYKNVGEGYTAKQLDKGFTAYLFVAASSDLSEGYKAYTQQNILDALKAGTAVSTIADNAIASSVSTANGRIATVNPVDYAGVENDSGTSKLSAYVAIFTSDGKSVYFSDVMTATASKSTMPLQVVGTTANSKVFNSGTTYSAAGWYTAVPEPTSSMLLMLGVGLLALRRKQK